MKTLHYQPYIDELETLKNKMIEAEKFAERLPLFKDYILKNKLSNRNSVSHLGENVLDVYLGQTIRLYNYSEIYLGTPTNYNGKPISIPLVVFCINKYSMFGDDFYDEIIKDLNESVKDLVYFYDSINSKYYIAEENLEEFCDKLSIWYKLALAKNKQFVAQKKKEKLLKELKNLEE